MVTSPYLLEQLCTINSSKKLMQLVVTETNQRTTGNSIRAFSGYLLSVTWTTVEPEINYTTLWTAHK